MFFSISVAREQINSTNGNFLKNNPTIITTNNNNSLFKKK